MKIIIGIDPGKQTGVAVAEIQAGAIFPRLTMVHTGDFWATFELICGRFRPEDALLVIENAKLNFGLYAVRQRRAAGMGSRAVERMASDIGGVQRESELLIEGFRRQGYQVQEVRPAGAKWSDQEFRSITGSEQRTNAHVRDAARLAWEVATGGLHSTARRAGTRKRGRR